MEQCNRNTLVALQASIAGFMASSNGKITVSTEPLPRAMSLAPTDPDVRALLAGTLAQTRSSAAVICLCAAWCSTCREYAPLFEQVAAAHPQLAFRWVDIEDEADALGDLDIDTFPTLVVGAGAVQFAGPVLPQAGQIERLLKSLGL
jgi:thiol-disulfide isomerase/thioredoxin